MELGKGELCAETFFPLSGDEPTRNGKAIHDWGY